MEEYLRVEDFEGLLTFCEETELQTSKAEIPPEIYGCLLALYLLKNELEHAKLLWSRTPELIRGGADLAGLWRLCCKLWRGELRSVYPLIDSIAWPAHLAAIVDALKASLQGRVLLLIGRTYTSISVQSVLDITGLSQDQLVQEASARCWLLNKEAQTIAINSSVGSSVETTNPQQMLSQLAHAVSFLEC